MKTKKTTTGPVDPFKRFNSGSATTAKKETKKAKSDTKIAPNDCTEDNKFVGTELVTPKLDDTERREVIPEEIIVNLTLVLDSQ